jgi:hypothetical protein
MAGAAISAFGKRVSDDKRHHCDKAFDAPHFVPMCHWFPRAMDQEPHVAEQLVLEWMIGVTKTPVPRLHALRTPDQMPLVGTAHTSGSIHQNPEIS